jgi:uncharacterized SAM-binding protein YcdF (DUF218 family)/glycosyltransferase involved in cell wall biosynthesis
VGGADVSGMVRRGELIGGRFLQTSTGSLYPSLFQREFNKLSNTDKFLERRDFVIISSIDWSEIRQMPQQLATSLLESGHRVLFIENTGVRAPHLGDIARIGARVRNWLKGTRGFFDIQDDLTVFSPLFVPLPYSRIVLAVNRFLLSRAISKWMRINRFYVPVLITFLPTPLADSLIKDIDPELTIYYCANDMAGGSKGAAPLRPYEDFLFAKADAVLCNSNALIDRAKRFTEQVFLFPAGVDFAMFENARNNCDVPADLEAIPRPIVGYIGAISRVFDQALLVKAAQVLPEVSFVLIGPVYTDVSQLITCPNIRLLGKRPHNEVPGYIKGFDVALIPYIKNPFTDAVYSCKLNEYLAMGTSVVATDLHELRLYVEQHGNVLQIAGTQEEFVDKIRQALAAPDEAQYVARIKAARANSWEKRFESIYGVIVQLLVAKSSKKLDWQSRLTRHYRHGRMLIIKAALVAAACYGILFYTPIVWFAGHQLAVRHDPRVADAIVLFSGDGESSYINQSYQRRTVDAIRYFKSGYAPLIVLSSGKAQTFSEVEIIRLLLINRGVPKDAIQILEKYPRSTFENVALVKDILTERGVKSILFITAPYHSRRALWVWRRAMPELLVLAPAVVDTPKASPQWSANVDQIKVICYEYIAIAYYWWKGRL